MGFNFNPLTGQLDKVKVPVSDEGTSAPSATVDGDLKVAYVSSEGRLYFNVNDTIYYVTGTAPSAAAVTISAGEPIGLLLALTYAEDVT